MTDTDSLGRAPRAPMADDRRCHGTAKHSGQRCQLPSCIGRQYCRLHGGRRPRGQDHYNYKHGRYSKDLPDRMRAAYERAIRDETSLDHFQEIGLVDSRISDVLTRVDTGESGARWAQVQRAHAAFIRASTRTNVPAMREAVNDLADAVGAGLTDYVAWQEIAALIDQRRRLVDSERRHQIAAEQVVTVQQAMAMVGGIIEVLRSTVVGVVDDPRQQQQIIIGVQRGIERMLPPPG